MRWRLCAKHYLWVPDTFYLYEETSRETGKLARKQWPVPLYLDPDSPADQNYPGEIIVCHAGKGQKRDIIFKGPPTPDMEPLDDEAQALSDAERHKWVHPIESLPGDFSASLLSVFQQQIDELVRSGKAPAPAQNVSADTVSKKDFDELKASVALLIKENSMLKKQAETVKRA